MNRSCYNVICLVIFLTCCVIHSHSQILNDFTKTGGFNEQQLWIKNGQDSVTINVNAPLHFNKTGKTFFGFIRVAEWQQHRMDKRKNDEAR